MLNNMIAFKDYFPGKNIKRVLLYFENANEYLVDKDSLWKDEKPYAFMKDEGLIRVRPTHWLSLD